MAREPLTSGIFASLRVVEALTWAASGRRNVVTMIEGESRVWAIALTYWDYRFCLENPGKGMIYYTNTGNYPRIDLPPGRGVGFKMYGDLDRFKHDMTLCRMFDDLVDR